MENNNNLTTSEEKTVAIVCYLTIIGWLVAYFAMYKERKTAFSAYHIRQSLLLMLIALLAGWVSGLIIQLIIGVTGFPGLFVLGYSVQIAVLILWLIGFIAAIKGEQKPIPFIGHIAQRLFANL